MGQPQPIRSQPADPVLTALTIDDGGLCGAWRPARPRRGESYRWERARSEWVAVQVGQDGELGQIVVYDSRGQRQRVASFEEAIRLAHCWTL